MSELNNVTVSLEPEGTFVSSVGPRGGARRYRLKTGVMFEGEFAETLRPAMSFTDWDAVLDAGLLTSVEPTDLEKLDAKYYADRKALQDKHKPRSKEPASLPEPVLAEPESPPES